VWFSCVAGLAKMFVIAILSLLFPALLTNCGYTRCLSHVDTEGSLRALCGIAKNSHEPPEIRAEAAEALSSFSKAGAAACRCLAGNLTDKSPEVRYFSVYSIGMLRCTSASKALAQILDDPSYVDSYGTIADEVRWAIEQISKSSNSP
jgi:HEAT repeat protein